MSLLEKVSLPEGARGPWIISRFTVSENDAVASLFSYGSRSPRPGTYTKLTRNGKLVMSDTPAEMHDHFSAVLNARGHCLINGLGIGMVLRAILRKSEVTAVTVVEISRELVELVSPYYADQRASFVVADAYEYQPPKGLRYGMVWHDIWDDICADNLEGMKKLHRKYGRRADWQGSWCKYQCERANARWR